MRRTLIPIVGLAVVAMLGTGAPAATATVDPATFSHARVVTTFDAGPAGAFAESLAPDGRGGLVASVTQWGPLISGDPADPSAVWGSNIGQLWRVKPDGTRTTFGPAIDLSPSAMLLGVTTDTRGNAYVVVYRFLGAPPTTMPSGILRVSRSGHLSRLVTLPDGTGPNGVAIYRGHLFIADSFGAIWRAPLDRASTLTKPWLTSPLLLPVDDPNLPPIGANGIAFRDGAAFVTSWAKGLVLRIPVRHNGTAGTLRVFAEGDALVEADGISFDAHGTAWIAVNKGDGSLVTVSRTGRVSPVAVPAGSLDYPTAVVLGSGGTLFVANGGYFSGTPGLVALHR